MNLFRHQTRFALRRLKVLCNLQNCPLCSKRVPVQTSVSNSCSQVPTKFRFPYSSLSDHYHTIQQEGTWIAGRNGKTLHGGMTEYSFDLLTYDLWLTKCTRISLSRQPLSRVTPKELKNDCLVLCRHCQRRWHMGECQPRTIPSLTQALYWMEERVRDEPFAKCLPDNLDLWTTVIINELRKMEVH